MGAQRVLPKPRFVAPATAALPSQRGAVGLSGAFRVWVITESCPIGMPIGPKSKTRCFPLRAGPARSPDMATDAGACIICLDTSPPPIQSGCACRGDGGLAHVDCLVQLAASQQAHRGTLVWRQCRTCEQDFTGSMEIGLAEAWWSRVAGQAAESLERLLAEGNLANTLLNQGKYAQAERVLRDLHAVQMRVYGAEHPETLTSANNLAMSLSGQGKYAHAEVIQREVLGVRKRVLGAEDPGPLLRENNLAESLSGPGK
jgi:hypothetical protein